MTKQISLVDFDKTEADIKFQCGGCGIYYVAEKHEQCACDKCGELPKIACPECGCTSHSSITFGNNILVI